MDNNLTAILEKNQTSFFPLLGQTFSSKDFCKINLSIYSTIFDIELVQTYEGLNEFIQTNLKQNKAKIGIGGYLEKRALYRSSSNFKNEADERDIHLGIDLWTDTLTPIYAPLNGWIHSFQYNNQPLDYGATIILQHELEGLVFYTLYGHLTLASLNGLTKGKLIKKGTAFTSIGNRTENGGWVPHLHFQIIADMLGKEGDFPGVASGKEIEFYAQNSPNPIKMTGY